VHAQHLRAGNIEAVMKHILIPQDRGSLFSSRSARSTAELVATAPCMLPARGEPCRGHENYFRLDRDVTEQLYSSTCSDGEESILGRGEGAHAPTESPSQAERRARNQRKGLCLRL
jgi:hypothetical protein